MVPSGSTAVSSSALAPGSTGLTTFTATLISIFDPHHGYRGPHSDRGDKPFDHFHGNEMRDGRGHIGGGAIANNNIQSLPFDIVWRRLADGGGASPDSCVFPEGTVKGGSWLSK